MKRNLLTKNVDLTRIQYLVNLILNLTSFLFISSHYFRIPKSVLILHVLSSLSVRGKAELDIDRKVLFVAI